LTVELDSLLFFHAEAPSETAKIIFENINFSKPSYGIVQKNFFQHCVRFGGLFVTFSSDI